MDRIVAIKVDLTKVKELVAKETTGSKRNAKDIEERVAEDRVKRIVTDAMDAFAKG